MTSLAPRDSAIGVKVRSKDYIQLTRKHFFLPLKTALGVTGLRVLLRPYVACVVVCVVSALATSLAVIGGSIRTVFLGPFAPHSNITKDHEGCYLDPLKCVFTSTEQRPCKSVIRLLKRPMKIPRTA